MNSKQIEYFLTLSSLGSFSKAAEKLCISQPSLSQYIKKLESEVGCELFVRSGMSVALTQQGEVFLRYARTSSDIERNMFLELADIKNECGGNIKVGISHFRCSGMMPDVVSQFRKIYPNITVSLHEKTVAELTADMPNLSCDIFILPHECEYHGYESIDIAHEEFALAVPVKIAKKYSLGIPCEDSRCEIDIKQLDGADFVTLFEGQKAERELLRLCNISDTKINVVARCVDIETMYSFALSGVGAALLPRTVLDRRASDLRVYAVKNSNIRKIAAFLPESAYRSKPIKDFLNICIEKNKIAQA